MSAPARAGPQALLIPDAILQLQAMAGNAAVSALLSKESEAIARAIASKKADAVREIADFSPATNAQRLELLEILLDMWSSNPQEETTMLNILESSGGGLGGLMAKLKEKRLTQKLFDHIDAEPNKRRLTTLLARLGDEELNRDLLVFNRSFLGNVGEGLRGGLASLKKNLSVGSSSRASSTR